MEREASNDVTDQLEPQLGGQLILKPAPRRGRWPDDDAVFLSHGLGLIQYEFVDYQPAKPRRWPGTSALDGHLSERLSQWVAAWQRLADGLPKHYSPLHCREFDIQRYNRLGLSICRELVGLLPADQQLCFRGAKRKGALHRSWLLEHGRKAMNPPGPRASYYDESRDPQKWVRIMGDYASTGIWEWSGAPMEPDALPVPAWIKARLADWARRFFAAHDSWQQGDADNFGRLCKDDRLLRANADEGLAIARAIKVHLPAWTVVYFDTDLAERYASRAMFQYEIR